LLQLRVDENRSACGDTGDFLLVRKGFSIAGRVAYSTNIFLKIKTVFLHDVIPEMPRSSMRHAKYFYDNPLHKYLEPKTDLIYLPYPVCNYNAIYTVYIIVSSIRL
jgi:hypothetical protein